LGLQFVHDSCHHLLVAETGAVIEILIVHSLTSVSSYEYMSMLLPTRILHPRIDNSD
jgi:hypothetical protein